MKVKVADAVWIGTALLHKETGRDEFTVSEIKKRIMQDDILRGERPGIQIHISQHCVANKPPNPGRYRMLFETRPGYRRLYRKGDYCDPKREGMFGTGGKIVPDKREIPEKYHELIDWYNNEYSKKDLPKGEAPTPRCYKCGGEVKETDNFCFRCGQSLKSFSCPSCGKTGEVGDIFCRDCGTKLRG
jgi:hypothetical protein